MFKANCRQARHALEQAILQNRKIVYMDEILFTKSSVMQRDWSRANSNLAVDQQSIYTGYKAVIASMTEE